MLFFHLNALLTNIILELENTSFINYLLFKGAFILNKNSTINKEKFIEVRRKILMRERNNQSYISNWIACSQILNIFNFSTTSPPPLLQNVLSNCRVPFSISKLCCSANILCLQPVHIFSAPVKDIYFTFSKLG